MPQSDSAVRRPRYGSGQVLLVDGPYDGERVSGFIARGLLVLPDGEYRHVAGGDAMALYWVSYPVILLPRGEAAAEIADNACPKTTPDYTC